MRSASGLATLEATLMIALLVPILFAILEFGSALERWLAQDAATVQAARYAGELGGDLPEVRRMLGEQLRAGGIDPSRASIDIVPARVGWREPVRVTVSTTHPIAIPFLFTTTVPLRSSALARGEVNR